MEVESWIGRMKDGTITREGRYKRMREGGIGMGNGKGRITLFLKM